MDMETYQKSKKTKNQIRRKFNLKKTKKVIAIVAILLTILIASCPLILITFIELSPTKVATAQIVSFIIVPFFPQDYTILNSKCKTKKE